MSCVSNSGYQKYLQSLEKKMKLELSSWRILGVKNLIELDARKSYHFLGALDVQSHCVPIVFTNRETRAQMLVECVQTASAHMVHSAPSWEQPF